MKGQKNRKRSRTMERIRIHLCSELINTERIPVDNMCFERLKQIYINIETPFHLGSGEGGAVFKLSTRKLPRKDVAVKLLSYSDNNMDDVNSEISKGVRAVAKRELAISCEINKLRKKYSSVFVTTLGYLLCSNVPKSWMDKLSKNNDNYEKRFTEYLLIFMRKPPHSFLGKVEGDYYQFDLGKYSLSLFFLLLHGIYIGRKRLGFVHGDIASRNILFDDIHVDKEEEENWIPVRVENVNYLVLFHPGIVPKIIDFGTASTKQNYRRDTNRNDLSSLIKTLGERTDISNQEWYQTMTEPNIWKNPDFEAREEYNNLPVMEDEWQELSDFLQTGRIFQDSEFIKVVESNKNARLVESCVFCHQEADLMFPGTNEHRFCNSYCAEKIEDMADFLP